jgi:hypothetical protein
MSNIKAVVTFQNQDDLLVLETFALSTSAEMSLSAPEIVADSRTSLYRIIVSVPDYDTANAFLNTLWAQAKTQNIEFVKCDLIDLDTFDASLANDFAPN